jgi:cellulose synthase/poly-beta-1,6-N-acetylglucosamine synthase-like glycosyltransferase
MGRMGHRRDQGAGELSSTTTVSAAEFDKLDPRERAAVDAFLAEHPAGEGAPLTVVIPAFNEEPTVADVIREIPAEAAGLATETIVVVDGARDATAREAISAGALVCDVPVNRGQGAALKLGYWLARARGAP